MSTPSQREAQDSPDPSVVVVGVGWSCSYNYHHYYHYHYSYHLVTAELCIGTVILKAWVNIVKLEIQVKLRSSLSRLLLYTYRIYTHTSKTWIQSPMRSQKPSASGQERGVSPPVLQSQYWSPVTIYQNNSSLFGEKNVTTTADPRKANVDVLTENCTCKFWLGSLITEHLEDV